MWEKADLDRKEKGRKIREAEKQTLSDSVREEHNASSNPNFIKLYKA